MVVTSDCRMMGGDVSKYIRNLGQIHGLAKAVEDVKRLKALVDEAMQDPEVDRTRDEEDEQEQEGFMVRRSGRIAVQPRPNYYEVSADLQCDEEGGFLEEETGVYHQTLRPTTQGVVMKALLANPGYRFNPNGTMASVLIAGHRWMSHTRKVRGDGKLRSMLLESKALQNDNVLSSLEPEAVDVIDLCPLCLRSDRGCAYGNQVHLMLFCPKLEDDRRDLFRRVENIMKRATAMLPGKVWHVQYPGEADFIVDPRYQSEFQILSGMKWLLPLLNKGNKRISSNVPNTWLLSHKLVVDKRIFQQLREKWLGSRASCVEVMDDINQAVVKGFIGIACKAQAALQVFYSEVRQRIKLQSADVDESEQEASTDPCVSMDEDSKKPEKVIRKRMFKCAANWCREIESKVHIQSNKVSSEGEVCKRCSVLERAEKVIINCCNLSIGNHQKCKALCGAVGQSDFSSTVKEIEKMINTEDSNF